MKTRLTHWCGLLAAGTLSFTQAHGASSPVIGYYKFTVPAGQSIWVSGFVTKKEFQAQATSISPGYPDSVIHFDGPLSGTLDLHYVEILDGDWAGLVLDIESNTTTSVTVKGDIGPGGFNLPANVSFAIRKHATLSELFKGAGLAPFQDQIVIYDDNGERQVFYTTASGNIVHASNPNILRNNELVYPGQGFILAVATPRQVTFGKGEVNQVKDTPTKIGIYGNNRINLVGLLNPVVAASPLGTGLAESEQTPLASTEFGLIDSGLAPFVDQIIPYSNVGGVLSSPGVFYYRASDHTIIAGNMVPTALEIPHGVAVLLRPQVSKYFTQPPVVAPL